MKKLELGSGSFPTDGYLHADIRALPGIDVICDLRALPFWDETFNAVLSKHVVEHFSWRETPPLLREWARVLKHGGTLEIQCPNLAYLCDYYAKWFRGEITREKVIWFGPESDIFGGQKYPFDYHKTGFSFETLSANLIEVGIINIVDLSAINGQHNLQYQLHLQGVKD